MANGNENNVEEIYNDLGITNLFKNIDNIQQLLEGKKTPKSNELDPVETNQQFDDVNKVLEEDDFNFDPSGVEPADLGSIDSSSRDKFSAAFSPIKTQPFPQIEGVYFDYKDPGFENESDIKRDQKVPEGSNIRITMPDGSTTLTSYDLITESINNKKPGFEGLETVDDYVGRFDYKDIEVITPGEQEVEQQELANQEHSSIKLTDGELAYDPTSTPDNPKPSKYAIDNILKLKKGSDIYNLTAQWYVNDFRSNYNLTEDQQLEVNKFLGPKIADPNDPTSLIDNPQYNADLFKPIIGKTTRVERKEYQDEEDRFIEYTQKEEPHKDILEQARKGLIEQMRSQGEDPSTLTQDQIEDYARFILANNLTTSYEDSNATSYLKDKFGGFNNQEAETIRAEIFTYLLDKRPKLDANNAELEDIVEVIEYKNNKPPIEITNLENLVAAREEKGAVLLDLKSQLEKGYDNSSQEDVDRYNILVEEFNSKLEIYNQVELGVSETLGKLQVKQDEYNSLIDKYHSLRKEIITDEDLLQELDYFKRSYGSAKKDPGTNYIYPYKAWGVKLQTDFLLPIFQTTSSFVDEYVLSPESFIAKANPVTGLPIAILGEERAQKLYERTFISKGIKEFNFLSRQQQENWRNELMPKPVEWDRAFDNLDNFTSYMFDQTVNFSSYATRTYGFNPYLIVGTGAGEYVGDRKYEEKLGIADYSNTNLRTNGAVFGSIEYVLGGIPTARAFNRITRGFAPKYQRQITNQYKNRFQYYVKNSPLIARDMLADGIGEELTPWAQSYLPGVEFQGFTGEGFFNGMVFNAGLSNIAVFRGALLNNFSDYDNYKNYRDNTRIINGLRVQLQSPILNKKTKNTILERINEVSAINAEILNNVENNIEENLTSEGINLFTKATQRQENLRIEAEEIINNKNLPKDIKNQKLKPLKTEFDKLQEARDAFREGFTKKFLLLEQGEQNRLYEAAAKKLQAQGNTTPSESAIFTEAENMYNEELINKNVENDIKVVKGLFEKGIKIDYILGQTNKSLLNRFKNILNDYVANPDYDLTRAQADKIFDNFEKGINDGTINGINFAVNNNKTGKKEYQAIVSKVNSILNGKSDTGFHEINHTIFTEALGSNPKAFDNLAKGIMEYLDRTHQNVHTRIQQRTKGKASDEVVMEFLEEVAAGNVNTRKGKATGFLGAFQLLANQAIETVTGKKFNFNFKGKQDTIDFLVDLGKKIKSGDLSIADIKGIRKESKTPKVDTKPGVKLSETTIGNVIKALVPPGTTKQQYDTQVIGDVYTDLVIGNRLDGVIRKELNRFGVTGDNVFGKPIDNFLNDVKQRLFETSLTRFNPEVNDDLGGFVISELKQFRIGDVVNRYRREQSGTLDIQAGEVGAVRAPVADVDIEAQVDTQVADAPRSQLKEGLVVDGKPLVDEALEAEIEANTIEIVEGVTPEVNDKDFKTFIKDAAQQKSFKLIKNQLKDFGKFLDDNYKVLFSGKNLPISTLVAMERRKPVDKRVFTGTPTRLTTQAQIDAAINEGDFYVENEKQGPSKYPRKNPTIEEVKEHFGLNPGSVVGASTKGTRKDGLVNAVAFGLFRDMVPGVMNRADIVAEDIAKVSAKLGVDPTIKFSVNKAKENAGKTRFNEKVSGSVNISRIEDAKRNGFTPSAKYTNDPKKLYDRNKELPKKFRSFEGETVIQGISRVTNNFLSRFPEYEQFLNKALTFGVDRSPFGVQENWNNNIIKRKSREQASFKKPNYTDKKEIKNSWLESTKKPDYVKNELKKLDDLIQFYKDFNEYYKDNKNDIWFLDEVALAAQNAQTSPLRGNAPTFLFETKPGTKEPLTGVKGVEEHTQPQNEAISILTGGVVDGNINEAAEIIRATYMQGFISLKNNDLLDIDYKSTVPDLMYTAIENNLNLDPGLLSVIRLVESNVDLNNQYYIPTKQLLSEYFFNDSNINIKTQKQLINDLFEGNLTLKQLRDYGNINSNVSKNKPKVLNKNLNEATTKYSKSNNNDGLLNDLNSYDQALRNARDLNAPKKGISIFDFDDTLATSKSKVIVEMPNGTTKKITPAEFARQHSSLEQDGATFDFSEFNKVVDGKPGPLAAKIKKAIDKFGNKDVFVLTARPQASATSIKAFLDGIGVNIPLANITGLADGTPQAKANWVVGKASQGYNDFYFTDDVYKNVKAVQDALEVLDVKSKTRLAYSDRVKKLDRDFNDIIEAKTNIAAEKEYSKAKAKVVGANKGTFKFFIPPSAEDFVGLLYNTLAKGKLGDSQMAWYKKNLLDPYASAMAAISRERIGLMDDYKAVKKQLNIVPKNLRKKIAGEGFTNEQAVRAYIWNKQGMNVPGLSKTDLKDLVDYVESKPDLKVFGDQLININKGDGYAKPGSNWLGGTITTDLLSGLGTTKRAKHLQQWQQNVDIIFSEKNLNKLEAANGAAYRNALENILERMKTGRNRNFSGDTNTGKVTDWLTNSIGTIMFFNTRSALLQTISAVNFVNFSDNNIFKAGKAFGNQKQFWSDFMTLMNSEFLVDRRRGLRINVNEADIANMANQGGARGVVAKLLEIGFLPTQIADSFAIASGGASFYRNRINTYKKQGLSDQQAQTQAFNDFREIAEESQQSSRPDRISMQQAGPLGRIILAFANTPMQYARLIKKAASDLKNRRGDVKTNISKIIYYGFVQNLIFNALQQAVFAIGFGAIEDEEDEKEKYLNTANNMMDSLLRGVGITGAFTSVGKNIIYRTFKESQKDNPKYEKISFELARISPPISSKLSRLNQAGRALQWEKDEMIEKGFAIDNPALMAGANVISAFTNIPIDRLVRKANNVNTAVSQDLELWERFALLGGWQAWEIGIDEDDSLPKAPIMSNKKKFQNKQNKFKEIKGPMSNKKKFELLNKN